MRIRSLYLTPAVPFSHPLIAAALNCLVTFIKVDEWTVAIGKRLGSAKTTVKSAVPNDRKERADPADEKDRIPVAAQGNAIVICRVGIWKQSADQCAQSATTARVMDQ